MDILGWLQKTPIVSLLFAAAMAAVPFILSEMSDQVGATVRFENAREDARDYLVRNPQLDVDTLGELLLDAEWVAELQDAQASSDPASNGVDLPPRLLARSQARLDALVETAYDARLASDPAWRLGVLDAQTPARNYVAHAFIHEAVAGVILSCLVLLIVGAPLERAWGSSVFAAFVMASIPATAQAYRLLDGSSGVPWSGAAGLSAALLGAYFIRGLGGHFVLPGWILLPGWLGVEAFVVRSFWIDDFGSVPWATLCAAIGLGAGCAGVLRLMNVEARVSEMRSKAKPAGPNPVIARAARLRSDGDPYQAFDLIQAAWREEPEDQEISEAFFDIAVEVAQPEAAASAILPSLRTALRKGELTRAVDYWFPLASRECETNLEPTALIRLSEALLDAGHAEQALFSMRTALETGASSGHATRVVYLARDLDEGLTRRAAKVALADPGLEPNIRAELEPIASNSEDTVPTPSPEAPALSRSQLDRRVSAEHQTFETTAFPLDLDQEFSESPLLESDPNETALADQALDTGALSIEALGKDAEGAAPEAYEAAPSTGDVLSHWNDPTSLDQDSLVDVGSSIEDADLEGDFLEPSDLETPDLGFDFGFASEGADLVDPRDDETDSDFTPLMDATDELTSPMAAGNDDTSTPVFDQPTAFVQMPDEFEAPTRALVEAPQAPPPLRPAAVPTGRTEIAFGGASDVEETVSQPTRVLQLRSLKAIEAVPVEASAAWIEIDATDRGKSKLPLSRIEAISVAAVDGLGPRPVLVLDFVLNWTAEPAEPMKLIRFRSDRFDPLQFVPDAANPLAALTAWVGWFEERCELTCLPSREILDGHFARFASLREYERDALMAEVAS